MNDDDSLDAFCESLKSLTPARQQLDVRQVFYSAGLAAAGSDERRSSAYATLRFLAAMFVGIVLGAPFAYRAGQSQVVMPRDGVAEAIPGGASQTNKTDDRVPSRDNQAMDPSSPANTSESTPQRSQLASAFASWLSLNEMVAASSNRSTNKTLTAFHGSMIQADRGDLSEFPSPMIRSSFAFESQQSNSEDDDLASGSLESRPLAVGDRQWVFSNLEESR